MEFYETINKRRSIRQFEDKPVPREVLERILDAGLKAPSSNHQRRWELVALTDKHIILDVAKFVKPYYCRIDEPKTPQQEMFKIAYPRQRTMIEESACVILPYFKQKYGFENAYGLMDYGATWALIENMLLAATAEGLGSVVHIPVKKEPEQIRSFCIFPTITVCPPWSSSATQQRARSSPRRSRRRWRIKSAGTSGKARGVRDMEFYEVIDRRKTSREWTDREVDFQVIKRILTAGMKEPSWDHYRNWQFIVLHTREEKENAYAYAKHIADQFDLSRYDGKKLNLAQKMYAYAMPRQFTMLVDCPYVIVPLFAAQSSTANG